MNQLTRQEVEGVVERLKNPNPRLYCPNCNNDTIKCTDCDCILWKNDHTYIGAVLEKAIKTLKREDLITKHVEEISYTLGLLEGMKEMLEYSAGKCKPEDQF